MNFYKAKTTPMVTHFRRADGVHVMLSSVRRKKRSMRRKTVLKVHKNDSLTHRVIILDASERGKFLLELTSLAYGLSHARHVASDIGVS